MSLKLGLVAAALVAATSFSAYAAPEATPAQAQAAVPVIATAPTYGNPDCPRMARQECPNYQDCPRYHENGGYHHGMRGDMPAYHHGAGMQGQQHHMGRGPSNFGPEELNAHTSRMLRDWCPKHNQPLAACLGPELQKTFKDDYMRLYDLQDQVFIKEQILQAQVNAGEDASTITKYAGDVNKARREYRNFVAELKAKVHQQAAIHKAVGNGNAKPIVK